MNVLVTGGLGYIGSHLVDRLRNVAKVTIVDNGEPHDHLPFMEDKNVMLMRGNYGDRNFMEFVFEEIDFDCVFHFGGYIAVGESVKDPIKYYENNVKNTITLLAAMEGYCDKLIFSSTAAVYGDPKYLNLDEKHPLNPTSPYGHSKLMIEQVIEDTVKATSLECARLRYFNAAGGWIPECHLPETHVIPLMLGAIDTGSRFKVFGDDYDTPDGTCVRDYISLYDLIDAHMSAFFRLIQDKGSVVCNLGTGVGVSVNELITAVNEVTGYELKYDIEPRRAGDSSILVAAPHKALVELGWEAQYKDIKEIVEQAWTFFG